MSLLRAGDTIHFPGATRARRLQHLRSATGSRRLFVLVLDRRPCRHADNRLVFLETDAAADLRTSMVSMSDGLRSARRFTALSCPPPIPPPAREIELRPFGIVAFETMTPSMT